VRRLVLVILTFLAVLALVQAFAPVLINNLAREVWALPEQVWLMREERERDRKLSAATEAVCRRVETKNHLTEAVLEGRLSLAEAARRFRDCDRCRQVFEIEVGRAVVPIASDQERYCRLVIGWIQRAVQERPDKGQEVLRRLEAELEELVRDKRLGFP